MPRLIHQNPKYRKHKASNLAVVTLGGTDIYLGPYGTKASRDEYDRVVGKWLAAGRRPFPRRCRPVGCGVDRRLPPLRRELLPQAGRLGQRRD
jgi:hypothetical protein